MKDLVETELLRARWRRTLERHRLDRTDREDFAEGGLASRLQSVTTQLLLLPADPELDVIAFDPALSAWLEKRRSLPLDTGEVTIGLNIRRTAHAIALVDGYAGDTWASYLAVHRSGTMEYGLGERGGWIGADRQGTPTRVFALTATVARVWALLRVASRLEECFRLTGPYQLTVALRNTGGAVLAALGEGWAEPGDFGNRVRPCQDDNLLWHLQVEALPDEDGRRILAYAVGERIEDAWGVAERRYLANRGVYKGLLDPRKFL